jgi:hypothetical protein
MKRLFILMLSCGLLLLSGAAALGAVHDTYGDFVDPMNYGDLMLTKGSLTAQAIHDSFTTVASMFSPLNYEFTKEYWYVIEPQAPFFQAVANSYDSTNRFAAEYWTGDQSFSEYSFTTANTNITCIRGSYLADSGWFFGAQFAAYMNDTYMLLSPGYRWDVGENGFVAVSLDYLITDDGTPEKDILGYDVDYKFFTEKAKFFGQLYWNAMIDTGFYDFALNYQLSESFALGGQITLYDEDQSISLGFTWSKEKFVLDVLFEQAEISGTDYDIAAGSFLYDLNATFALGFAWYNSSYNNDNGFGLKAKYVFEGACGGELNLGYLIPTDSTFEQAISLRFIKYLK